METILLTGGAGFIGSHLAKALLDTGLYRVLCLDNLDDFYSPELKEANLNSLYAYRDFSFVYGDISRLDAAALEEITRHQRIDKIVHLAAKAGVRPSIDDPAGYYQTNVTGMVNLLEFARSAGTRDFIYASSSSVYGDCPHTPWTESQQHLTQISPYAATKIAGEQLGQVYAHLYPIRFTALRLFTVYGPRQRPDLAIHKFYNLMKQGLPIQLYGDGGTSRDYTFVGDVVSGILAAVRSTPLERFSVFNLGSGRPVSLLELVWALERVTGITARINFTAEQPGDVKHTWADISRAGRLLDYHPVTSLEEGLEAFMSWKEQLQSIVY